MRLTLARKRFWRTVSAASSLESSTACAVVTVVNDTTGPADTVVKLQLPQGWKAVPAGPTMFNHVGPGASPVATFLVTPPSYAPSASAVVHATATTGGWLREAGTNVTVSG